MFLDLDVDEGEKATVQSQVEGQVQEPQMPPLVEDSSDDEEDDADGGDDEGWGPDDDVLVDLVRGGVNVDDTATLEEAPVQQVHLVQE